MSSAPDALPHPFVRPPRSGAAPLISPTELQRQVDSPSPPLLLDIRSAAERRFVHLPGDRHIPLSSLGGELTSLPHDRPIVAYDHFGAQARRAARFLQDHGFPLAAALEGELEE